MKQFLKYTLASLFALVLFSGGIFFLFVGILSVFEKKPFIVEDNSMLVFDMSMNISDSPPSMEFVDFLGDALGTGRIRTHSLADVVRAILTAADDDRITSLFLYGQFIPFEYGTGYAALLEVRDALEYFKESGKPIIAYMKSPRIRDYFLASVADTLIVDPYGVISLNGMASQQIFFREALDKIGVGVQIVRAGEYKSAVEPFTRSDMSEENREQTLELLEQLWIGILEPIGEGRGMDTAALRALSEEKGFFTAEEAEESGLADRVGYFDEVQAFLAETHGVDGFQNVPQANFGFYLDSAREASAVAVRSARKLAVVYLEGNIVDGEGGPGDVGGDRFAREMRELRQDDSVGAVVVRINSAGGSASASEVIRREVALTREAKPVVVSLGTVAASGGYWVATDADYLFAQPNTITGSIGVFGILPNIERLSENIGIGWETVKTGPYADLFAINRYKTEEEIEVVQGFVDQIYDDFLSRVAAGRGLEMDAVRELAGGRVWSGARALELGLVDEIGGLSQAMSAAAVRGNLGENWELYEFPRARSVAEILTELMSDAPPGLERSLRTTPLWQELQMLKSLNDSRGTYARMPYNLYIE